MNPIKPIETLYKGYRFRSRLEARWAVFFDAMGFDWTYEPEGFVLEDGTWYLPDFKISDGPYVEVKPSNFSPEESHKALLFSKYEWILLAIGEPAPKGYETLVDGEEHSAISLSYHKGEKGNWNFTGVGDYVFNDDLIKACNAAKSARFEFGESGSKR